MCMNQNTVWKQLYQDVGGKGPLRLVARRVTTIAAPLSRVRLSSLAADGAVSWAGQETGRVPCCMEDVLPKGSHWDILVCEIPISSMIVRPFLNSRSLLR